MGDYKAAKEAFVAGNPGQSLWEVNAISLVGLVSPRMARVQAGADAWKDLVWTVLDNSAAVEDNLPCG